MTEFIVIYINDICNQGSAKNAESLIGSIEVKMTKKYIYHFPVTLAGTGKTPEEAWYDAIEAFQLDPGGYEHYRIDQEVEE